MWPAIGLTAEGQASPKWIEVSAANDASIGSASNPVLTDKLINTNRSPWRMLLHDARSDDPKKRRKKDRTIKKSRRNHFWHA